MSLSRLSLLRRSLSLTHPRQSLNYPREPGRRGERAGGEEERKGGRGGGSGFDGDVYRMKPLWEVVRALLVFKLCSYQGLVERGDKLLWGSRWALGARWFGRLMRLTFYGQFVGGESAEDLRECARALGVRGVLPMLAVPCEGDVEDGRSESWFEGNLRTTLSSVDLVRSCNSRGMIQIKVTGLLGAELCATISRALIDSNGTEEFSETRLLRAMEGEELPFPSLSNEERIHLQNSLRRLKSVGEYASERGVWLLIDAETTMVNPAISLVCSLLAQRFNRDHPNVWNTYQCYLKDTEKTLQTDISRAVEQGVCFGVKLVRGAYMDQERQRAGELGYTDPLHPSWGETDHSYQKILDRLLYLVSVEGLRVWILVATHNEGSVGFTVDRMKDLGIERDGGRVHFAQLLGMSDHLSLSLGTEGYSVYKSLPYGTVDQVIPYLLRRAQENRSALDGLRRERRLLSQELRRRMFPWWG